MNQGLRSALAAAAMGILMSPAVYAAEIDSDVESSSVSAKAELQATNQRERKYGVYASIGNPYPTLLGVNGAYHITENIRTTIGYGEVEVSTMGYNGNSFTTETISAKTYAAGGEYLFLESAVRPVAGLRVGYFDVSGDGEIEIDGFKKSTGYLYANAGLDWVSQGGYQIGAGFNLAVAGATGSSLYLNSGYFF